MPALPLLFRLSRCLAAAVVAVAACAHGQAPTGPRIVPSAPWPQNLQAEGDSGGGRGLLYLDTPAGDNSTLHRMDASGADRLLGPAAAFALRPGGVGTTQSIVRLLPSGEMAIGSEAPLDPIGSPFRYPGTEPPRWGETLLAPLRAGGPLALLAYDAARSNLVVFPAEGRGGFSLTPASTPILDMSGPLLAVPSTGPAGTRTLLLVRSAGRIVPLSADEDGALTPAGAPWTLPGGIRAMLLVNRGHHPALLTQSAADGSLWSFPGDDAGSFGHTPRAVAVEAGPGSLLAAAADLNGDGLDDLLTVSAAGVEVLLGQPDGSFRAAGLFSAGSGFAVDPLRSRFAVGDFDGDGHLDFAANAPDGVHLLFGNGDGTFRALAGSQGTVSANPEPSFYGAAFTLIATLQPGPGLAAPTGTVIFGIDGTAVGQGTLSNGSTNVAATALYAIGQHTMTAVYSGDATYAPATFTATHTVDGLPSTVVITSLTTPIFFGQVLNGVGTVNGPSQGGSITFFIDGVSVCVLPILQEPAGAGPETCPSTTGAGYNAGGHTIHVTYSGDAEYAPSSSPMYPWVVLPDTTTAALSSSENPAAPGDPVTFTVAVAAPYATPGGTVTLSDGTASLAQLPLNAQGRALFTTSTLALGTHLITAVYAATLNFNASTATLQQRIGYAGTPDFRLVVNPPNVSAYIGSSGVLRVEIVPLNHFLDGVTLSCENLPHETTCNFGSVVIPAGGGATNLLVSPAFPHACGATTLAGPPTSRYWILLVALSPLLLLARRRRLRSVLLGGLALMVLPLFNGCGNGHCTDFGTDPRPYTFTIRGTAVDASGTPLSGSSAITHTVTIHLDVLI